MENNEIGKTARGVQKAGISAHDAFLLGWSIAKSQAVRCLEIQYEGHKHLVSYALAAEVLRTDMNEIEKSGKTHAEVYLDRAKPNRRAAEENEDE